MPDINLDPSTSPEDLPYEEEVQRNKYSLKAWLRYLQFKSHSGSTVRNNLYERALRELPGSYKLWHSYLEENINKTKNKSLQNAKWEKTNNLFERSLNTMHKMPVIWEMYCEFLILQKWITRTRHTFDRALRSLPVTQHKRIWNSYLPWARSTGVAELGVRIYKRALKIDFSLVEEFIEFLVSAKRPVIAAEMMVEAVNQPQFVSKKGKSKHELWLQLCDIINKNPECGRILNVDSIMRQGITHFVDQVGRLWVAFL